MSAILSSIWRKVIKNMINSLCKNLNSCNGNKLEKGTILCGRDCTVETITKNPPSCKWQKPPFTNSTWTEAGFSFHLSKFFFFWKFESISASDIRLFLQYLLIGSKDNYISKETESKMFRRYLSSRPLWKYLNSDILLFLPTL